MHKSLYVRADNQDSNGLKFDKVIYSKTYIATYHL